MNKAASLSLIIPAYNEEAGIDDAIKKNLINLSASSVPFEIIVIDDGSKDNTKKIVEQNYSGNPLITFYSKPNGGFGSAVKKGIELAKNKYILFVPVDSPLNEKTLSTFMEHLGKADILVSHRISRKGYSFRMKLNSGIYHFLISKAFNLSLKDYNWIHLYDRAIFDKIVIEDEGIFMLAEVLIKAKKNNYSFFEFPIEMEERMDGVKTAASFKAAIRTFKALLRFYFKNRT